MAEFACSRCGKNTLSEQKLKRHERYCRHRAIPRAKRRKSCLTCVRAKARCVANSGVCVRCQSRKITCEFELPKGQTDIEQDEHDFIPGYDDVLDPYTLSEDLRFNLVNPNPTLEPFQFFSTFSSNVSSDKSSNPGFNTPLPYPSDTPLELYKRRDLAITAFASAALATGVLHSYPGLMRQRRTFPPFVHDKAYGTAENEWKLPVSLVNAIGIAHMFHGRTEESKRFIWKTIRCEVERIRHEYLNFDKNELLASSQAILIYIIMRTMDKPHGEENIDRLLLATFNEVLSHTTSPVGSIVRREELRGQRLPWKEWIYVESLRRTVIVGRIAVQIFVLDIYLPCPPLPYYAAAPLPSSKLIWRAESEEQYEREWESEVKVSSIHGMRNNGDLVKLKNGITEAHQSEADWAAWYQGCDELGMLAVISTSLK